MLAIGVGMVVASKPPSFAVQWRSTASTRLPEMSESQRRPSCQLGHSPQASTSKTANGRRRSPARRNGDSILDEQDGTLWAGALGLRGELDLVRRDLDRV